MNKYLRWLLMKYFQMRLSEPAEKGALKYTLHAIDFLEEVAGVAEGDKLTNKSLYVNCRVQRTLGGCVSWQSSKSNAPFSVVLAAMEEMLTNEIVLVWFRTHAWWILSAMLAEHCGSLIIVDYASMTAQLQATLSTAKLSKSKPIGDRSRTFWLVAVDRCSFFTSLHASSVWFNTKCIRVFNFNVSHFWSPHSERNFHLTENHYRFHDCIFFASIKSVIFFALNKTVKEKTPAEKFMYDCRYRSLEPSQK